MISWPQTREEFEWCRKFLADRGSMKVADDAHVLVWLKDGRPVYVVSFDTWLGFTCQIQMASTIHYIPKALREAVFDYTFRVLKRKMVFAMIDTKNPVPARIVQWLGFREAFRMPECSETGGDIVIWKLTPAMWKASHGQKQLASAA